MAAPEEWRQAIPDSVTALVRELAALKDVDLGSGVLPTATLWPARAKLLELDGGWIDALQAIVGAGTGRVLTAMKGWKSDPVQASRELAQRAAADSELRAALAALVDHFGVQQIFAEQYGRQYSPQLGGNVYNVTEQIKAALVNIGGVTNIQALTVELDLPPITVAPRRVAWYWYLAAAVGLVAALGVIAQMVRPLVEAPKPMTGAFNIAVARFGELDERGEPIESQTGVKLASSVYERIRAELAQLDDLTGYIQLLPPDETGGVAGRTPAERARAARQLAEQRDIDLIIYGNIAPGTATTSFAPEFYLSARTLESAAELAGQYPFGAPLQTQGDGRSNPAVTIALSERLSGRGRALSQFVFGLGYYVIRDFDNALVHFTAAEQTKGWEDGDGKEVIYLFLGNTSSRRPEPRLDDALRYYEQALAINPEYARAWIGQAEIKFLNAMGEDCAPGKADIAGLQAAQADFARALSARDQPPEALIQPKADFGFGRVLLCQSLAGAAADLDAAERSFQAVVATYEQAESGTLKEFAAESHANLGLISWVRPVADDLTAEANYRRAVAEYQAAFELSANPQRQALYKEFMARLHHDLGDYAEADAALDEAVALDPANREGYRALQQELQALRPTQ